MLVIRLSRQGRRNHPAYRLMVAENSKATDGKFVEIVGNYNPISAEQPLVIEEARIRYWLSQGATPSNTVARLLNRVGFDLPVEQGHKAPKQTKIAEQAAAVAPVADTAVEAPKAESTPPAEELVSAEEPVVESSAESATDNETKSE